MTLHKGLGSRFLN
uniref:Uncharacterized protein n=1 Tax=Anguilla anguilla TaxID=7936 RepID=A0A0E9XLJ7_ANGAN